MYCIKCFISVKETEIKNKELREQRWELLKYLNNCIEHTHVSFIPEAEKPVAYIHCPINHEVSNVPPHLFLDKIKWGMSCSAEVCKQVPVEAYNLLLKHPDKLSKFSDISTNSVHKRREVEYPTFTMACTSYSLCHKLSSCLVLYYHLQGMIGIDSSIASSLYIDMDIIAFM